MTREELEDALEANEALTADGFEDALIGYAERFNSGPLACGKQTGLICWSDVPIFDYDVEEIHDSLHRNHPRGGGVEPIIFLVRSSGKAAFRC